MKKVIMLAGVALVFVATLFGVVACTDPEQIALARARENDAEARLRAAPYAGEIAVMNAETDATLVKLRALTDTNKEMRDYDAAKARLDFVTIVLEMQALNLAIQQETEAANEATAKLEKVAEQAEPIGHNAAAAAHNSWFGNIILVGLSLGLISLGVLMMISFNKLSARIS